MCQFDSLYFNDDGYVIRCKLCGHYQLGFGNMIISISQNDFEMFCKLVTRKCGEEICPLSEKSKCIIVPTPASGNFMMLTKKEAMQLQKILDEADNELKTQSLLNLFKA